MPDQPLFHYAAPARPAWERALGGLAATGRPLVLAGVVLPLALIGVLKFTQVEIDALKPLISNTPWLAWLYPVFGPAVTSYFLGAIELLTAALFIASPWSARAGIAAGLLGTAIFAVTTSTMFAAPIWMTVNGLPFLNDLGGFLIKDVALLGMSLLVLDQSLGRRRTRVLVESLAPVIEADRALKPAYLDC